MDFDTWRLGREDRALDEEIGVLREGVATALGDLADRGNCFWQWLKTLAVSARAAYNFVTTLLKNIPSAADILYGVPWVLNVARKDPVVRDTVLNHSFLQAVQDVAGDPRFARDRLAAEVDLLSRLARVQDAALAEAFARSSALAFLKKVWELSHLGPVLKRIPQVTAGNAWVTLQKFWNEGFRAGVRAAALAAVELVTYILSTGVMTGLIAKVCLVMQKTELATYFGAGSYALWGLVQLLHKSDGHPPTPPACARYAGERPTPPPRKDSLFGAKILVAAMPALRVLDPGEPLRLPQRA